ncbi:PAS domain S-box protein [Luteibacter sp.]|jgi:PAS domain S-box-containing protein|uniref:PAS domain S-box protein n=1 Tax=Luteibacter sp. TaxID=1886636 RepID=UPI002F416FC1
MRLVADSATDYAFITTDPEGCITSWSKGAERIFGYSASEAIGRDGDIIFTPEDRARSAFRLEMDQARTEGRANDDRWHLHADGKQIFCSGIATPRTNSAARTSPRRQPVPACKGSRAAGSCSRMTRRNSWGRSPNC